MRSADGCSSLKRRCVHLFYVPGQILDHLFFQAVFQTLVQLNFAAKYKDIGPGTIITVGIIRTSGANIDVLA
jgi:hypothetical protein